MLSLSLPPNRQRLRLLCLGAHSDDLEIGCGGTILEWLSRYHRVEVTWAVLSATGSRAAEARRSAGALLRRAARKDIVLGAFRDGRFPGQFEDIKLFFESLKSRASPDIILTHRIEDRHQDHRLVGELSWQTWRDHMILEYEIPKYEGDLGQPNVYVPISGATARRKIELLLAHFGTQRSRDWFKAETFSSLMRLRAIECRARSGYAEAFHARKLVF